MGSSGPGICPARGGERGKRISHGHCPNSPITSPSPTIKSRKVKRDEGPPPHAPFLGCLGLKGAQPPRKGSSPLPTNLKCQQWQRNLSKCQNSTILFIASFNINFHQTLLDLVYAKYCVNIDQQMASTRTSIKIPSLTGHAWPLAVIKSLSKSTRSFFLSFSLFF